jgi:Tol biopolymer transport system component
VAKVEGGEPVALTDGKSRDDMPAWSPDGKYLVFVADRNGDADLWLMRADGSGQTRLTTAKGADWLPRWFVPR